MKLKKAFWKMIFVTDECVEVLNFLKLYIRMCTNINNYVPVRPWLDDPDEEEQRGCGYRDDMIAQFKQDLYNKNVTLQSPGKDDPIDTLETELYFGLISLVMLRVQYLIISIIMIITTKDWIIQFMLQR